MLTRLSGFGFLAGKEIKEAGVGNLGLQDRKYALLCFTKYLNRVLQSDLRFNGSRNTFQRSAGTRRK